MFVRTLTLILLGHCCTVFAAADKQCNGDMPVRRCTGTVSFDPVSGGQKIRANTEQCAAITWRTGTVRPRPDAAQDDIVDVKNFAQIVGPEGQLAYNYSRASLSVEALMCWELEPIANKKQRPTKLRDAGDPVALSCPENPKELGTLLPLLVEIGKVRIDPDAGQMNFFGMPLTLVEHAGSEYLGVSLDFSVTVHKKNGAYRIVLPDGNALSGRCQ